MNSESIGLSGSRNGADMNAHIERSPHSDSSIKDIHAPVQKTEVHDHGSKSDARLALIFSVAAVGMGLVLCVLLYGLWSRHDLLRIYYNDIRTELIRQGGNPHPHMPSESP